MSSHSASPTIRDVGLADVERCVTVLTSAFHDDPVGRLLVPDPTHRPEVLRRYYQYVVAAALETGGRVDLANDVACAVWLSSATVHYLNLDELAAAVGPDEPGFRDFAAQLERTRPVTPEHEYLLALGVSPHSQHRGLGTALLRHRLIELDRQLRPAYLEATTERAWRGLYHPAGFKLNGTPITTPEGPIIPLWRSPRLHTDGPSATTPQP